MNKGKAYILGVLCGDGHVGKKAISLTSKDREFIVKFFKCFEKEYGKTNNNIKDYRVKNYPNNIYYRIAITKPKIVEKLQKYDYLKCDSWVVPEEILNTNEKIISSFLMGFFDSEGMCSYKIKGYKHYSRRIYCSSTNKTGLEQINKLLNVLGVCNTKLYCDKRKDKKYKYYIAITNFYSLKIFKEKVGFTIIRKNNNLSHCVNDKTERTKNREEYFKFIKLKAMGLDKDVIFKKLNIPISTFNNWWYYDFKPLGCEI